MPCGNPKSLLHISSKTPYERGASLTARETLMHKRQRHAQAKMGFADVQDFAVACVRSKALHCGTDLLL